MAPKNGLDWALLALKRYAEFKGRSTRSEFWYFQLFCYTLYILSIFIGIAIHFKFLDLLVSTGFIVPLLAVAVRRLHDTNHSGWWYLVPIVDLVFYLQKSDPLENRFGLPFDQSAVENADLDKLNQIEKLCELKNKGILTEEEYQYQKSTLL